MEIMKKIISRYVTLILIALIALVAMPIYLLSYYNHEIEADAKIPVKGGAFEEKFNSVISSDDLAQLKGLAEKQHSILLLGEEQRISEREYTTTTFQILLFFGALQLLALVSFMISDIRKGTPNQRVHPIA